MADPDSAAYDDAGLLLCKLEADLSLSRTVGGSCGGPLTAVQLLGGAFLRAARPLLLAASTSVSTLTLTGTSLLAFLGVIGLHASPSLS
ncbi:hypothetical protein BC628DRAFT_1418368 [Trametes gibbosa]|nr:hypothetical protein BC628DRAFT_1418368 [Trametes gibbosa]